VEYLSSYLKKDLSSIVRKSRLASGCAVLTGTVVIGWMFHKSGVFLDARVESMILGVILFFVIMTFLHFYYKNRLFVVGLKFNEENRTLKIFTRNILSLTINEHDLMFMELTAVKKSISDGISNPMYEGLILFRSKELIGYFYNKHKMWSEYDSDFIYQKLLGLSEGS
jgi:hypothetical protein